MKKFISPLFLALGLMLSQAAVAEGLGALLPEKLVDAEGNQVELASLEGKLVALYFSAQWCPPCRAFTPGLVEFRNKHAEEFQVVFISSDRTEADMKKYMADYKMNFLAVPHDSPARATLGRHFGVRGIPTLIILDDQGNVISRDGRGDLTRDRDGALATWQAKVGG